MKPSKVGSLRQGPPASLHLVAAPERPRVAPLRRDAAPLRVLIASHSHPEVSSGGAEIAAFQLFTALQARADCQAWFLGCDRTAAADRPGAVLTQPYSAAEYIYASGAFDWFKFANPDPRFRAEIERLFIALAPDVAHFHHYINFGVEVFQHLKRVCPHCRIVLTLHEYLAICHHFGQMVTPQHQTLCCQSSPARCNACFPDINRADFFLRSRYISRFLDLVDDFVSPSQFLAERYIAWGVPAAKMKVIENLMPPADPAPPVEIPAKAPLRIGVFGQISRLKGIDVVFDAAAALAAENFDGLAFEIFGDYRGQPPPFQAAFLERLGRAGRNIRFNGPYDRQRVNTLMRSVHAVLVPSIWWENSPVVIQEALRNRRPVICADIGGMAEKVRDGIDGMHFPAGNALALTSLLRGLAEDREALAALAAGMTGRPAAEAALEDYLGVYRAGADATVPLTANSP
jgi:glycosyltransferase involved in cell wall biosynthesis